MAERPTPGPNAPKRAADRLPRVPEILFLLERKKAERQEKEDAEKYSLVRPEDAETVSKPLPSEDASTSAQDASQGG